LLGFTFVGTVCDHALVASPAHESNATTKASPDATRIFIAILRAAP